MGARRRGAGPNPPCPGQGARHPVVDRFPDVGFGLFPGGPGGEETPVPIPNTEVKGPIAEGTARFARGRVGRRRGFLQGGERFGAPRPFF